MLPNVINYIWRRKEINEILFWLNYKRVLETYDVDGLFDIFQEKFKFIVKDQKRNSWLKRSKSIISSAKFLSQFTSIEDFRQFIERFSYNEVTRVALPMLISQEILWYGFALACDFIKELWYTDYCKPDIHLIDVFYGLWLCERNDYSTFKCIVKTAKEWEITPYKLDKTIWLICSGNFYFNNIKIWSHKREFIEYMKSNLSLNK